MQGYQLISKLRQQLAVLLALVPNNRVAVVDNGFGQCTGMKPDPTTALTWIPNDFITQSQLGKDRF